jgi:hypothetical protein
MNANEKLLRQYMYVTFCFDKKNLINAEQWIFIKTSKFTLSGL